MSNPTQQLEAKANREASKLARAHEELKRVGLFVKASELPGDVKLRLYAAIGAEIDLVTNDQIRVTSMRKAAEISRSNQKWVTSGDK